MSSNAVEFTPEQESNVMQQQQKRMDKQDGMRNVRILGAIVKKYTRPPDGAKFSREPRYNCRECRDSGWVSIWHPSAIKAAVANDGDIYWKRCQVLCTCPATDSHGGKFSQKLNHPRAGRPSPVYGDQPWHINANLPDSKAKAAMYVHRLENYNPEFEAFETNQEIT